MAQHDFVIDNGPGNTVRADLNAVMAALKSSNSGAVAPSSPVAGMLWLDTSNSSLLVLNVRNQTNTAWVAIATSAGGTPLPLSGGTMTGPLILSGDPATGLGAATRQYVDNLVNGLDVKQSVKAATTANVTLSGTTAMDGVTIVASDRVLVKNQTAQADNGIYVVAAGAWSRAADMDSWAEVPGASVWVEQGTTNADRAYVCTSDASGTLGTTAIVWSQFGGSGSYQGANALLTSIAGLATDGVIIKTGSTASVQGIGTAAEIRAGTPNKIIDTDAAYAAGTPVTGTYAASYAMDFAVFQNLVMTLTGNIAFTTPANLTAGKMGMLEIYQDGTGGRTATFSADFIFESGVDFVLSTGANACDLIGYYIRSDLKVALFPGRAFA